MEESKKKKILFIGSIFVALMFITSYFSSSGTNFSQPTSSKSKPANNVTIIPFPATGYLNATVSSYGGSVNITTSNISSAELLKSILNNASNLLSYSKISNTSFVVFASNIIAVKNVLGRFDIPYSIKCLEYVNLPSSSPMQIRNETVNVLIPFNYTLPITSNEIDPINSIKRVHVIAVVSYHNSTFSVYNASDIHIN
ncbi:MAG: hypothetical protein QXD11_01325 [Candidatus Micrarchaeaceae archaeon]